MSRNVLLAALAIVVLAAGWFAFEIIDTDAPDAVSTDAALQQLADDAAAAEVDAGGTSADAPAAGTIDAVGTWVVDDEFGDFGFSNASGSFAGFRVGKTFFAGGGATAVGRSGGVTGELVIENGALTSGEIVVDMTEMRSDERARESVINDVMNVAEHPTGTFVVAGPVSLDTTALTAGETVSVAVDGQLTISGVTQDVTVPIEATIVDGGRGVVVGSTELVWADYGVETPESSVASVADDGVLEFQLVVRTP